jgi:tripartite-type tricarboxylate transporter receptor subunit TctC
VKTGDRITVDVPARRIHLEVSDDELAARRAAWTPPPRRYERGYGWMFSRHILQADQGCDFDFLETTLRRPGVRARHLLTTQETCTLTTRRHLISTGPRWPRPLGCRPAPPPGRPPLRIIVPFAPGGTSDVIARLISKPLQDALGQNVVVENKTGANGIIGAAATAQATDEHTMLLSDMSSLAISPLMTKDLPYKPEQLKGATLLAYSPHLLVAHPSVPASNMKELVAQSPEEALNVASVGLGSANHLGVVDIALATGMKWQHVPFRGGAQASATPRPATRSWCLNGMLATLPLVQAGRLKLIGVSKATRMALIGDVPTIAEQGVKGFESGTYQGIAVPASMSKANIRQACRQR